jgi:hypothetical protein
LGTTKIWITIIKFFDEHKNLEQINEEQRKRLMDELRSVAKNNASNSGVSSVLPDLVAPLMKTLLQTLY